MTDLLIGFPDIPAAASSASGSLTAGTYTPITNLFGDGRSVLSSVATAASGNYTITLDLGASTTKTANFLAIGRADLLKNDSIGTVTLKGGSSNVYASATTVYNNASFSSATLYGPNSEDFITTFAASSAFRYWFVNYNATATSNFYHSHLYFGTAMDLGRDPIREREMKRVRKGRFSRRPVYQFELKWEDISYTAASTFLDTIARLKDSVPVFLWTTSYHYMLNDVRIIMVRIKDVKAPTRLYAHNDLTVEFEEVI